MARIKQHAVTPRMTNFTSHTHKNPGGSNVRARAKTPSRRTGFVATLRALHSAGGSGALACGLLALSALVLLTAFPSSALAAPTAPQIKEVRVLEADQNSATLEAKINPNGSPTTYRFEWGPTVAYGSSVPADFNPFVGEGENAIRVSVTISGLSVGTIYHYRFVARSEVGITSSPDQTVETLDSCGLPEGRCFEMVSPQEVGLVGTPGYLGIKSFRAATSGGALAYLVENGLPPATSGGEVIYRGDRSPAGWISTQLSPPMKEQNRTVGGGAQPSFFLASAGDLSCALVKSPQLLTSDPAIRPVVEAGGENLFRRNADGTYSAISDLVPLNMEKAGASYAPQGMSRQCEKVVFASEHQYAGIAGVGTSRLYEWEEGALRNVGCVPSEAAEEPSKSKCAAGEAIAEASGVPDSVSVDGSKVFFAATSQAGNDIGKRAVFARLDGARTLDISQSALAPDTGATYRYATPSGSRVFFTANSGLTAESSGSGTDLYEYDFGKPEGQRLTDLSVTHELFGAAVVGLLGASADGSVVYFAGQGQLVPGKGRTFLENVIRGTYSIYARSGGELSYVGVISSVDAARALVPSQIQDSRWTSWVSPDGRYLLFESSANITGYQSGGAAEAYLFDADALNAEPTICISCRQDGAPPVGSGHDLPLASAVDVAPPYELHGPQSLVQRGTEARVYFESEDKLAAGAVDGAVNFYEWAHGQVSWLATEPLGVPSGLPSFTFAGASADGTDVYIVTPETLTWEDRDARSSVYDARISGGFEEPAPPALCDPDGEGSCQGSPPPQPGAPPAASATFIGSGNVKPHKCKKGFASKRGKCVKKAHRKRAHKKMAHKKRGHGEYKRHAKTQRRVGK